MYTADLLCGLIETTDYYVSVVQALLHFCNQTCSICLHLVPAIKVVSSEALSASDKRKCGRTRNAIAPRNQWDT